MSGSLESRVERRFIEIEGRLRGTHTIPNGISHPDKLIPTSYIDKKIEKYKDALETALRNAPCSGCRRLVLASLTGLAVFLLMEDQGKTHADITDEEIGRIKKEVERKYANY